jgi:hypothetical protein
MAENKKSFLVYADLVNVVRKMKKEDAGELFLHMLEYVNDTNPATENPIVDLTFEPIKQQMKRDLKKWEKQQEQRVEAGKKSAETRKAALNEFQRPSTTVERPFNENEQASTVTVNVTDTVTGNVNETVNKKKDDIDVRKLKFAETLKPFLEIYGKDLCNDFYKYWTEPNKSNTKFRAELEKTWDVERRLETWARNDKNFKPPTKLGYSQLPNAIV